MIGLLTLWAGCGGGEPTRSYCEAVCDWATGCQGTERTVDADALREQCLADTRAADPGCEKAESGALDPVTKKTVQACVNQVDDAAAAGECAAFVGSIDEIKTGTAPAECLASTDGAAVFDAARAATQETGAELCQRYTETYCHRTEECVLADFDGGLPQAAQDALGDPYDLCVQRLDPVFTTRCVADDLYAPEAALDDVNTARQGARECLRDFADIPCEDLLAGDVPKECGASFTSTDQATALATALFELAQDYQEYAVP